MSNHKYNTISPELMDAFAIMASGSRLSPEQAELLNNSFSTNCDAQKRQREWQLQQERQNHVQLEQQRQTDYQRKNELEERQRREAEELRKRGGVMWKVYLSRIAFIILILATFVYIGRVIRQDMISRDVQEISFDVVYTTVLESISNRFVFHVGIYILGCLVTWVIFGIISAIEKSVYLNLKRWTPGGLGGYRLDVSAWRVFTKRSLIALQSLGAFVYARTFFLNISLSVYVIIAIATIIVVLFLTRKWTAMRNGRLYFIRASPNRTQSQRSNNPGGRLREGSGQEVSNSGKTANPVDNSEPSYGNDDEYDEYAHAPYGRFNVTEHRRNMMKVNERDPNYSQWKR